MSEKEFLLLIENLKEWSLFTKGVTLTDQQLIKIVNALEKVKLDILFPIETSKKELK